MLELVNKLCPCGKNYTIKGYKSKVQRSRYCSQVCKYTYRIRPKGLKYEKHKENPTSFKKGQKPWNDGIEAFSLRDGKNSMFKGDRVGYDALHDWVKVRLGKANLCCMCGCTEGYIDWANISQEYKRDINDWMQLCRKCHINYDKNKGFRTKGNSAIERRFG